MQRRGITVGLASDGPASSSNLSMLQAMKFAALVHKGAQRDAEIMTAEKALEMATIDGATAIGMADEIGSLELGKRADIVVADLSGFCVAPVHQPVSALVYSARGDEVDRVYVDGTLVVRAGAPTLVNPADVRRRSTAAARALIARAGTAALARRPWRSIVSP